MWVGECLESEHPARPACGARKGRWSALPMLYAASNFQATSACPDMAAPLRAFANDVRGVRIAHCGHFLPEKQPTAVAAALAAFFHA